MAFMRGLHEAGRRVPDEMSVVGFDGHPLGRYLTPALTTVQQDFAELGRRSFELLGELLETGHVARAASSAGVLVVRESSGPPRT
jgi:DNA-binding LacI/PurR family transcriptional regulator